MQGLLEPSPRGYQRMTIYTGVSTQWSLVILKSSEDKQSVCSGLHNKPLVERKREDEKEAESNSYTFRNSLPLHPSWCSHVSLDLDTYVNNPTTSKLSRSLSCATPITFISTQQHLPPYLQSQIPYFIGTWTVSCHLPVSFFTCHLFHSYQIQPPIN